MEEEVPQKITWDSYKAELKLIMIKTKEVKHHLIKEAKKAGFWSTVIGYPAKILLTLTATGGGVQILSEESSHDWITILRTVFEIVALILVTTKDNFNFEKKKIHYLNIAKSVDNFHQIVRFQNFQIQGTEGDRYDVLKNLKEMYSEIVQNNQVIQMIDSASGEITPGQMESQSDEYSSVDDTEEEEVLKTARNSPKLSRVDPSRRRQSIMAQQTNDRNRMAYLHAMIDDIK